MYALGKIGGFLHLYIGQEAVAVGATSARRASTTTWCPRYREHGHCLAKGSDPRAHHGRAVRPPRRPQQGQGRLDAPLRQDDRTSSAATPSSARTCRSPPAPASPSSTAAATRSILCYFGDGAVPQGEFHEAMNLAAALEAAGDLHLREQPLRDGHRHRPGPRPDGDLALRRDLRHARRGGGRHGRARRPRRDRAGGGAGPPGQARPALIEARTYRFRGHSMRDPAGAVYRTQGGGRAREAARPHPAVRASAACSDGVLADADVEGHREGRRGRGRRGGGASPTPRRSRPAEWLLTDVYKD